MGRKRRRPPTERDVKGLKYLRAFGDVLDHLRDLPAHGNRQFRFDHYVGLLLVSFFNPVLGSLRALQQATGLENVQEVVGVKKTSLGAMSEAASGVFDPAALVPIIEQLTQQARDLPHDGRLKDLSGDLLATDGSFLRCLPRMTWALFRHKSAHRAVKMHMIYDVLRGVPADLEITDSHASEKKVLRKHLQPGKLYVVDRGYIDYSLFQEIDRRQAFFVARLKDISTYESLGDRPLTAADLAAGVTADQWVTMGSAFTKGHLTAPVRRVVVRGEDGHPVILLTNTDLPAEVIGLIYRHRWQVELFFRWFKCILGCTHWLSESRQGLTTQVYVAIIASILIRLWFGRKPTRRTFEMICLYFQGWANAEELAAHIESLKKVV
jgi:hypothetical protein